MNKLSSFLELLKAPFKILSENGKLMAITATIYLILYSILFILYMLSANPLVMDLVFNIMALTSSRPGTPEFTQLLATIRLDIGIFLGVEAAYVVLLFFVALFAQTIVVIIGSCYYAGYVLTLKELILKVSKTWTRPFLTLILVQLIALGYTSFFILPFLVPSLVLYDHPRILIAVLIIMAILFLTLNIYLAVVWNLGVVISVVEDCYGFLALAKAKELVKGNRLNGFLLILSYIVVFMVIAIIGSKLSPAMPIVVVVQIVLIGVISMFQFMANTGYYFQCKTYMKKYSQIPSAHVLDEDLP